MKVLGLLLLCGFFLLVSAKHHCIHDSLDQIRTDLKRVQADQVYEARVGGAAFNPIRIYVDTRFVSISDTSRRNFLVNQLIPAAVSWIRSALAVVPVSGNLILKKQCRSYYENPYRCVQYWEPTSCLDVDDIPAEHLSTGVPADLILYVTSKETEGNTLAYATACQYDQKNRPVAGNINFGPQHLHVAPVGSQSWAAQLSTAIHEIFHVLGFSSSSFGKFIQPDGTPYPTVKQTFNERGEQVVKIVTPKSIKYASQHFNCPLNGVELENKGGAGSAGSHWKKRLFNEEFMTAIHSDSDFPVYSGLTLALMEDSGWYQANYSATTPLAWGKNAGCTFATAKCISGGVSIAPDHFCTTKDKNSCSKDRRARAMCDLARFTSALPVANQYFSDPTQGGQSESMDFCPHWTTFSTGQITDSVCTEASNQPATNYWGETYGVGSRCFESTVVDSRFSSYYPNQGSSCHTFRCAGGLKVMVGTQWVDCSVPGVKTVPGFRGTFTCPDSRLVC